MEMRVSFVAIFFCGLLLGSSSVNGDDDDNGGSSPLSPSSSVPCSLPLDVSSKLLPFNTSSLICSSVWSSQGFTLMFKQSGASLWSFVLSAPDDSAYIAVGFSPSGRMIGASAVVGWVTSSGAGIVKQYYLGGYRSGDCPPDKGSLKLMPGSSTIVSQSSKLYLAFQLNIAAPESNLVLAVGPRGTLPGSDNYLPQHRTMVRVSVNYVSGQGSSPDTTSVTSPSTPSSSVSACSANLNINASLILFDTSSLKCYTAWRSRDFTLLYKQSGPSLWSFVLTAPDNNVYIAIGFSSKGRMIGSDAVAGWVPSSGAGVVKRYTLGGYSPGGVPPDQGNLRLVDGKSQIISQSSRLYLAFQLNTSQPESNLIYAIGPSGQLPSSDSLLPAHVASTSTSLNYATGESSSVVASSNLQRFHGVAGMLGWGVLLLIGVAIARFCKRWDPFWFYGHLSLQLSGFALGIACVISGFSLEDKVGVDVDVHKSLGVLILVLGCLQVTALLARPDKGSKMRRYWNWFHHYVGRAAIAFAIGNIFYGFSLSNEAVSWSIGYGAFLGILLAVCLVLEVCAILRNRESSHSV